MGKFKDKNGHSRWIEGKRDISAFLEAHKEKLPVLTALVKTAIPRAAHIIEAIQEVKHSKLAEPAKEKSIDTLQALLEDLDGDGVPDVLQNIPGDFALKKYITPLLIVFALINYSALQIIDLIGQRDIPDDRIATAEYWLMGMVTMWQAGRIIVNRTAIKTQSTQ